MAENWQCTACGATNIAVSWDCAQCGSPRPSGEPTLPTYQFPPPIYAPPPPEYSSPGLWPASQAAVARRQVWSAVFAVLLFLIVGGAAVGVMLRLDGRSATGTAPPGGGAATVPSAPADGLATRAPTQAPTQGLPTGIASPTAPATPGASPSPGAAPTAVGIVDIAALHGDPDAVAVGDMLDRYFSGINTKDYSQTLATLDPAGSLDTTDPAKVSQFEHGVSTTTDSKIVLHSIKLDTTGDGVLDVGVTFTSHQDTGYGPSGNARQTCTKWTITYVLTSSGDGYRIFKDATSVHTGC